MTVYSCNVTVFRVDSQVFVCVASTHLNLQNKVKMKCIFVFL